MQFVVRVAPHDRINMSILEEKFSVVTDLHGVKIPVFAIDFAGHRYNCL